MVVMIVATSNACVQVHFEVIDGMRYLINEDAKAVTLVVKLDAKYSVLENKEFTGSIFEQYRNSKM